MLGHAGITKFKEDGFLSIPVLATPSDVLEVKNIIDALYLKDGRPHGPFHNILSLAPELKTSPVFRACLGIAKQLLGRSAGYGSDIALYKEAHARHGTKWHQDAAWQGKYFNRNTVGFWIPLQAVRPENGCMHFIPLRPQQVLLPHRPFCPNDPYSLMTDEVDASLAVACPLPLGGACVHGPLTLHSTLANTTDSIRRAWILGFRPWVKWGFITPKRLLREAAVLHTK